jgi:hypothetical protein
VRERWRKMREGNVQPVLEGRALTSAADEREKYYFALIFLN